MKTRLTTIPLLIMFFALVTGSFLFEMPVVSSSGSFRSGSVSILGTILPPKVDATKNFGNSINITGNLKVSGNDSIRFAGVSPSVRARVFLNGSIDIVENGTLVLQYVDLFFVGSKTPYSRYIRLLPNSTNGHPQMIVSNATIIAATWTRQILNPRAAPRQRIFANVSFGAAIYAYGDSEITGKEFAFYRDKVAYQNLTTGGPSVIKCYDNSLLDLSNSILESVQAYNNAKVTIFTGNGARRALVGNTIYDKGTFFGAYNSSQVNLFSVYFMNTSVLDNAYMSFTYCTEVYQNSITTKSNARVDLLAGSLVTGATSVGAPKRDPVTFAIIPTYLPGINASGNSYISLNSSKADSNVNAYPVAYLWDNAVLSILQNCSVRGRIVTNDYSKAFISNIPSPNKLVDVWLEAHNYSSISIFNSAVYQQIFPPQIQFYDNSSLSLVNSLVNYGWIQFHDATSLIISNSTLSSSEVLAFDEANVVVANGSRIETGVGLRGNSRLDAMDSSAMIIYSLDTSRLFLNDVSVSLLDVKDESSIVVKNSTLTELSLIASNVTGSWTGFNGFFENSSLPLTGHSPAVSLLNTTVKALNLLFQGNSNVKIANSTISNLSVQGSSVIKLSNVSIATASIFVVGKAKVYLNSTLRVRVVDYFGNPLSGANVSVEIGYASMAESLGSKFVDANGWVTFVLFSGFVNSTGTFSFGVVTVRSHFGGVTGAQETNLAISNKDITMSMPLPSWSGYILPVVVLVAIVVVLVLVNFIFKRIRRTGR